MSRRSFLRTSSLAAAAAATSKFPMPGIIHRRQMNTVVLKLQPFANEAVMAVLPEFEAATGLKVEFDPGQSSGVDHLNEIATAYAAGDSPWDVVDDSDESGTTAARAGWLTPLDDIIPQETWDDFPESMKSAFPFWHGFDGAMYRVSHGFECGYFWYRKDIFDERGLTPPNTWEEMIELGMQVTDADNGVYATTDALVKGGLLHVYTAYLTSQTNGQVFDFDDGTAMALNLIYNMLHT
ncbi:MAG: extracellular solute-binding protein, partial [Anaerolineae bacterium]|nr:extracellular solute-binding protein [Anaerolineae bacterium]